MTLEERKTQLTGLLEQAQREATAWAARLQQLQGALAIVEEMIKEEEKPVVEVVRKAKA